MSEKTETIVTWLREQGDLYEEQGLSTDAEYGHRFHTSADRIETLLKQCDDSRNYSCDLQRMIQVHCRGELIPLEMIEKSPFLAAALNAYFEQT